MHKGVNQYSRLEVDKKSHPFNINDGHSFGKESIWYLSKLFKILIGLHTVKHTMDLFYPKSW